MAAKLLTRLLSLATAVAACGAATGAAAGEMNEIVTAETIAALDTRFYVSLENLNDIAVQGIGIPHDFIGDGGGTWVIDLDTARFRPLREDLLGGFFRWDGPYISYQPGQTDEDDFFGYDRGTPLDPWFSPYYLFTPVGMVRPPNRITLEYYGDRFDRYAIVSSGPDYLLDTADDLILTFGAPPSLTTIGSVFPNVLPVGDTLTVKGYNFGAQGGGVDLLFNGQPAADGITGWTATRIQKNITEADPVGVVEVALRRAGQTLEPTFSIRIQPPLKTSSRWWQYYE